jgi:hypothetical protein
MYLSFACFPIHGSKKQECFHILKLIIMRVIGYVGDKIYIHFEGSENIVTGRLTDSSYLEELDEYSSPYFIDLAIYGESHNYYEQVPFTKHDKIVYDKRIIHKPRQASVESKFIDSILPF